MKEKKRSCWKLFFISLRGYKYHLILSGLFVLLGTICVYLAPFVTSFTLDYVIQGSNEGVPAFLLPILDSLGGRSYMASHLYLCGIAYFVLTVGNACFTFLRRRETALASEGMAKALRDGLYRHLNEVPYDYHKHVSTGDLVQRCTSDVETVRRFLSTQVMEILRTSVMFAVALCIMFSLHPLMACISLATMPVLCIASFVYFRFMRRSFQAADEAEGEISTAIQENLTGVRVVRAFGQQRAQFDKFTALNENYRQKNILLNRLQGFYWAISDALGYAQIAVSLFAGILFSIKGSMTLGMVTLFVTYTGMLTWPLRQMGRILADLGKCSVSLGRLSEIMDAPVEKEPGRALKPNLSGDIVFLHVCFGYDSPKEVLDDISFIAHPGQTIAILGSTGSGKSSLVQLLQRLYACTEGHIFINNVDINDIEHGYLRRNIGIVLQEPFLYSRTIRENIRIVSPRASDLEVEEAARTAAVHDVIEDFEDGYDTVVGERGVTLSGGQQQRIAIARTLMQKAPILIFDDSMSAVDTQTDAKIRDALYSMRKKGVVFIISHRITTLCEADKILVLDHGKLVQEGTHSELIKQEGLYRRIAIIQDAMGKEA